MAGPATLTHSRDHDGKKRAQGCTFPCSCELIHQVWFSKGVFMTILGSRWGRCSPSLDILRICLWVVVGEGGCHNFVCVCVCVCVS